MDRVILHSDMNNFYASVECLFRPELKDVPMAVAGSKENRHGIILAKNQLAKERGVKTAEPLWQAKQKCPGIIFVPPNHRKYMEFSQKAMRIYSDYTDQLESFGLDECWLDVSGSRRLFGSGMDIAGKISGRIKAELGLTVSIGVSFNKIFAKLGSDYKKPDAITEITRDNFKSILWPLPAGELLCVGPATRRLLERYGIKTIGDIALAGSDTLKKLLGKGGADLWQHAVGQDLSPVTTPETSAEIKSIGNSTTTPQDLKNEAQVHTVLLELAEQVAQRLRSSEMWASGVQLSVRRYNLESYQRSCTLNAPAADSDTIFKAALELFRHEREKSPIRSLGIRAERLSHEGALQFSLFDDKKITERKLKLERTADVLHNRFGGDSLIRASLFKQEDNQ